MTSAKPDQPLSRTTDGPERAAPASGPTERVDEPPRPSRDNLGQVLRDAYRDALDEGVPDDMLDLLRKLD